MKKLSRHGSPVWVSLRVEWAHVIDLFEVDVGEDQFVVGGVDDGGPVGAGKHVGGGEWSEGPQHGGLCAQRDFLTLTQRACGETKQGPAMTPVIIIAQDQLHAYCLATYGNFVLKSKEAL